MVRRKGNQKQSQSLERVSAYHDDGKTKRKGVESMKNGKANHGSGKTQFNRMKAKGQSWTDLRDKAIKAGQFKIKERTNEKE
jgi:hypothetical protein